MKKKILILSFSLLMSLSFVTTALATPNGTSELNKSEQFDTNSLGQVQDYSSTTIPDTCTSEYDVYIDIKKELNEENTPKTYANFIQVSDETKEAIKNGAVEEALLERQKLSDEELYVIGYDDEDISLLRKYNGEPIEEATYLSLAMARIYTNLSVPTRTDDIFNFSLKWWWDQMPAIGFTDSIGTSWRTNDPNNTMILNGYKAYPTNCKLDFSNTITGAVTSVYQKAYDSGATYIRYQVPMDKNLRWAKQGCIETSIGTRGKHSLKWSYYKASYAHQQLSFGVDMGLIPLSGTLPFGFTVKPHFSEDIHRHILMYSYANSVQKQPDDR